MLTFQVLAMAVSVVPPLFTLLLLTASFIISTFGNGTEAVEQQDATAAAENGVGVVTLAPLPGPPAAAAAVVNGQAPPAVASPFNPPI